MANTLAYFKGQIFNNIDARCHKRKGGCYFLIYYCDSILLEGDKTLAITTLSVMALTVRITFICSYEECHYTECLFALSHYARRPNAKCLMPIVIIMLSVVVFVAIMLIVIIL